MPEDKIRRYEDSEWTVDGQYSNGDFIIRNKTEEISASVGKFKVIFYTRFSGRTPFNMGISEALRREDKEKLLDMMVASRDSLNNRKKRFISALERLTGVNYNPYSVSEI